MFGYSKVIQKDDLMKVIDNDISFLKTLIGLFEEQAKESLETFDSALKNSDWNSYLRATHDLKNIGRSIASEKLLQHAAELELFAKTQDTDKARAKLKSTTSILGKAHNELTKIQESKQNS